MSVRGKLFGAMALLVLLMALAYFFSTRGYLKASLVDFIPITEQEKAEQWVDLFETYYVELKGDWPGMGPSFPPLNMPQEPDMDIALFADNGLLLGKTTGIDTASMKREGLKKSIKVNGRKVGSLILYDRELAHSYQLRQSMIEHMVHVTFKVIAPLMIIALLIGFWLSRKLTSPLHLLTSAIDRVGEGDLNFSLPVTSRDEYGKVTKALNRMTAELNRSEQARKHLVADVAHELRTPLTIIQGQFELIQQNGQAVAPEVLLPMQDEVIRLSTLVNDLLQLSLAEAGKLPLDKKPTDLVSLLEHVMEALGLEAEEKSVRLTLASTAENATLSVDSHRITQVFYNLIGNAIRYTPRGGEVTILVSEKTDGLSLDEVKVAITDTGIGIPAEHIPYLFNRFYRVEDDRSRHRGGMGLGLAISKQLVEAHGGFIQVESLVGEGTTFTVSLRRIG